MQEIELSAKKKFRLKYNGEIYEIRKPTLGEARHFQALQTDTGSAEDKLSMVMDYLEKLGLPKSVSESFDGDELMELMEKLAAKKN